MTSLTRSKRIVLGVAIGAAAVTSVACKDFLKVEDPGRFSNEALDNITVLTAVANGVEGQFQQVYDDFTVFTGLNSDEIINSSTWIDWADVSTGRLRGDWPTAPGFATTQDELLRTRYTAQNAADRLTRVLGADAARSPLMAQVKVYEAWADLALGMGYCESPLVSNGPRAPDTELYKQAITKFGTALTIAQAAGQTQWVSFALAGRARANLLAGNYDAALADAQAVPAGFIKQALYSVNSQTTFTGGQFHYNRNRSGGLHTLYWSMVDTSNSGNGAVNPVQYVRDPWTQTADQRMAVSHKAGSVAIGVDNKTKHYAIQKYSDYTNPITLTSKREMNLIAAEVAWRKGDLVTAIADLNLNRTTAPANLPAFDATGLTATDVRDRLLSERFAELFVEGHRMTDLDRFNLVTAVLGPGRARKLPLSRNEILNNPSLKQGQAACPAIS
jgi:hypothetical protein